jgi:hypothetical protein
MSNTLEDRIKAFMPLPNIPEPGYVTIKTYMPTKKWKLRQNRLHMQAESRRRNRR